MNLNIEFWKGKKVLITGHTGFKGSWLCLLLKKLGSEIYGYALNPPTTPSLFNEASITELMSSTIGDVRDYNKLFGLIKNIKPEIVIHMAAQPLVRVSYRDPLETFSVNVMGIVTLLEAIRHVHGIKVVINVTTDKCYENKEWYWGYREIEPLGGYDPYSNSKACSEQITTSFRNSFFHPLNYVEHGVALASARAGNVIGGGDWAEDRLIPDFIRTISSGKELTLRCPGAIRPWQHVLEPLTGYLLLAERLYNGNPKFMDAWNFGPHENDSKSVEWMAKTFCDFWGEAITYKVDNYKQPHEADYLKLDCSKAKFELSWNPNWDIHNALKVTVDWYKAFFAGENMRDFTYKQITMFSGGLF